MMINIPRVLLEDNGLDGILAYFLIFVDNFKRLLGKVDSPLIPIEEYEEYVIELCIHFAKLVKSHNKPLLGSSFQARSEPFIKKLEDLGIPILPSPERSARSMGALYDYSMMRKALTD